MQWSLIQSTESFLDIKFGETKSPTFLSGCVLVKQKGANYFSRTTF